MTDKQNTEINQDATPPRYVRFNVRHHKNSNAVRFVGGLKGLSTVSIYYSEYLEALALAGSDKVLRRTFRQAADFYRDADINSRDYSHLIREKVASILRKAHKKAQAEAEAADALVSTQ